MKSCPRRRKGPSTRMHALVACLLLPPATMVGAAEVLRATAEMSGCSSEFVSGAAVLTEAPSPDAIKNVAISIQVFGLEPGSKHAAHLHETGVCQPCGAAGGHFDPGPESNSNPDGNHPHHSGDLPNLLVDADGTGTLDAVTSRVTLSPGPLSLFDADGSAVIIHVNPDSYCPEGAEGGCAGGARAACGIIRRVAGTEVN